jgi:hypothetical protein
MSTLREAKESGDEKISSHPSVVSFEETRARWFQTKAALSAETGKTSDALKEASTVFHAIPIKSGDDKITVSNSDEKSSTK